MPLFADDPAIVGFTLCSDDDGQTWKKSTEVDMRVLDKDNKVVFLSVDLIDDATDAIVLTGVPEGTKIIISGQDFVVDGEVVNVVEPDAATLKKLAAQFATEIQ